MTLSIEQACPFCGQFIAIRVNEDTPQEEREAMARMKCGCPSAQRARDIQEAMDKLDQVCGATSVDNGFDRAIDDDAMGICKKSIEWIYDKLIRDVVISTLQGDKIAIRADGAVAKVKRTCRKQMQL